MAPEAETNRLLRNDPPLRRSSALRAWITFAFLECLIAVQGALAYRARFFTVSQMRQRGIEHGLPFIWHFGMWSDLFIVSTLTAYLVGRHSAKWRASSISVSLAAGLGIASVMSWTYTFTNIPEAHVLNHHLTAVGILHLFYMAVAAAVFIQFFLFTENVTPTELSITGGIVLVHVFFGTHMALGVLRMFTPLDWYSGMPLKSIVGWSIVAAIALSVAVRSLWSVDAFWRSVEWLIDVIMYWIVQDWKPLEGFLKFLDWVCVISAITYFPKIIYSRLHQSPDFARQDWLALFSHDGLQLFLIGIFGLKYFFSRHSAKRELTIALTLFPRYSVPNDWSRGQRLVIGLCVAMFLVLYWALARYVDNITIVSGVMFVVACNDWRTRYLINANMKRYFADEKYAPLPTDPEYNAIKQRRAIVSAHLFDTPYLQKEAACAAGCGISFLVAMLAHGRGSGLPLAAAYAVLIVTLVANEIITQRWRYERDNRLAAVSQVVA